MAHKRCMLDKQGYTRALAFTLPLAQARARVHTQSEKYVILIAFPWQE
jgi:hypothetical protein